LKRKIIIILVALFVIRGAYAEEPRKSAFYKELNYIGGYSYRDRWVARKEKAQTNSVGFEYFRKFSNDYGDFLTLDLQARLAYDYFDYYKDAWSVEIHNAYLEYKPWMGHNIRVGHFDPAYGMEPVVDTHGTLFQTLMVKDLGFKKDWAVGYRGSIGWFDCQVAGGLGSGMSIDRRDGSYLVTARIGSPQGKDLQGGLSLLYGQVLVPKQMRTLPRAKYENGTVRKKRIGLDGQYLLGPALFKGEWSIGDNKGTPVMGFLMEIDYTVPFCQKLELKVQNQFFANDLENGDTIDDNLGVGLSYKLTQNLSVRVAYFQDLHTEERDNDSQVFLQIYFFGL